MENNTVLENATVLTDTDAEVSVPLKSPDGTSYSLHVNNNGIPYINGTNKKITWDCTVSSSEEIQDFPYADDLVETAMTYYRVCDKEYDGTSWSQGLIYRASNTVMSAQCIGQQDDSDESISLWKRVGTSGSYRHYKAIDCSTFANMVLKGYTYEESPYKNLSQFNSFRTNLLQKNTNLPWTMSPTKLNSSGELIPARTAADLAKYFYEKDEGIVYFKEPNTNEILKGSIGTADNDYNGVKKADLIFYAKKDSDGNWKEPNETERFKHISHVAICYGHSNTYGKKAVIESTNDKTAAKTHTLSDGTVVDAGLRIKPIEGNYTDAICMVVRLQV